MSDRLLASVDAGLLTKNNTKPGTAGRRAVDRVAYSRRTSPFRLKPGETLREATGHGRPEFQATSEVSVYFDRPDPWAVLDAPTRLEKRRAGRYASLQAQLAAGKISHRHFQRRVESWAPIRGQRLLADPERVLAAIEARRAADEPTFWSRPGKAA